MALKQETVQKVLQGLKDVSTTKQYASYDDYAREAHRIILENETVEEVVITLRKQKLKCFFVIGQESIFLIRARWTALSKGKYRYHYGLCYKQHPDFWDRITEYFDFGFCGQSRLAEEAVRELNALAPACKSVEELLVMIGKKFGSCALCGAWLTDAVSVERGIGPECIKKLTSRDARTYITGRKMTE